MSKGKSALGRGLGALLPTESPEETVVSDLSKTRLYNFEDRIRAVGSVSDVQINQIDPNPFQPRSSFDEKSLKELAASIAQLGIIQPVTVRSGPSGRFQLISGERRLRAAEMAGLATIPAYVRDADSETMLEMALVENVQRSSLNPIEISLGYRRLMDECDLTQEDVAEKVGKNRTTVANFIRLLKLPPAVQAALKQGTVSVGHARALLTLESDSQRLTILKSIESQGLSVRAVESLVRNAMAGSQSKSKPARAKKESTAVEEPAIRELRDRLRNTLSTQVQISPKGDSAGGKIEIEFYSEDDLTRLVDLIVD